MYRLLKKMGFDPKIIENVELRKELCSLLTVLTKDYEFYGKPYQKNLFTKERTIYGEVTEDMLLEMASDKSSYGEIIDDKKECITIDGYNVINNQNYSFDVIHDLEKNTYTILGYPTITHEFCYDNFLESFSVVYDYNKSIFEDYNNDKKKLNTLTSKRIYKTIDCDLKQETHKYSFGISDDRLLLISTYETYDGYKLEQLEREYVDKLNFKPNYIYKPGDTIFPSKLKLKYGRLAVSSKIIGSKINSNIPSNITTISNCGEDGCFDSKNEYNYPLDNNKTLFQNELICIQNYLENIIEEKSK